MEHLFTRAITALGLAVCIAGPAQAQRQPLVLRGGASVSVPYSPLGGNVTARTGTQNPWTAPRAMDPTTAGFVRRYGPGYLSTLQSQGAAGATRAQIIRAESAQRYREMQQCVYARGTNCRPTTPLTGGIGLQSRPPVGHTVPGHAEALLDRRRYLYGPTIGGTNPGAPFPFR